MTQIHRTVFIVEVLSEGPLELAQRDDDPFGLLAINYEINEGNCVGSIEELGSIPLNPEEVKPRLLKMGNDGEFFMRGDNFIEDGLVGYPNGWYVFNRDGAYIDGPIEDERDADAERRPGEGDWIGQYEDGYLDLSYAPDHLP